MHYYRIRRHGSPDVVHPFRLTRTDPMVRFMRYVEQVWVPDVTLPEPCWVWRGGTTVQGYARFNPGEGPVLGYRWLYERNVGPVPRGLQLDHLCRVQACVNPAHLEPVTVAENQRRGYAARRAELAGAS